MANIRKIRLPALCFFLTASTIACVWKWGISGRALLSYVFLFFLAAAAWIDLHTRHIPNCIVLGTGAAGMLSVPFFPEVSLVDRGIGIFSVSILLLAITLIVQGSFGGGDIKLMAASGIFLGWKYNLGAFALAVFAAGGWCIWKLLGKKLNRREQIAFGPFLCAGVIAEMLLSL